jgi:hypothetical protein
MVSVGAGVALALYEKSGRQLPTVMGFDPAVAWGTAAYLLTRKGKSKTARMARQAAIGLATIGASRSVARGSLRVGEDDGEDEDI